MTDDQNVNAYGETAAERDAPLNKLWDKETAYMEGLRDDPNFSNMVFTSLVLKLVQLARAHGADTKQLLSEISSSSFSE
jgi:hypothetical protein